MRWMYRSLVSADAGSHAQRGVCGRLFILTMLRFEAVLLWADALLAAIHADVLDWSQSSIHQLQPSLNFLGSPMAGGQIFWGSGGEFQVTCKCLLP